MEKDTRKMETQIRLEVFEFLHKKFLATKNPDEMDIIEMIQGEVLKFNRL